MIFTETKLRGAFVVEVKKLADERGFFGRSYCANEFGEHGLSQNMVQANVSYNIRAGTLRGMHYQVAPHQEAKLIRCTRGALYDVIVDLRPNSPTYKQWFGIELSADGYSMLYVPEDFAHGFVTLVDNTEATYQVSQFYTPGAERGLRWNDPAIGIEWPVTPAVISAKDANWPDYAR
jgi:dTDP-4-dehydrorhamnose 3,5-epimerase